MTTTINAAKTSKLKFEHNDKHLSVVNATRLTTENLLEFHQAAVEAGKPMNLRGLQLMGIAVPEGVNFKGALFGKADVSMADLRRAINLKDAHELSEAVFFRTQVAQDQKDAILQANSNMVVLDISPRLGPREKLYYVSSPERMVDVPGLQAGLAGSLRRDESRQ